MVEGVDPKKLYEAIVKGDVAACEKLVQDEVAHMVWHSETPPPLHTATMSENEEMVGEMLSRNPNLARALDPSNKSRSPLHIAAAKGHVEIAKKLVSAAPEACWWRDGQGMNPIHIAAMEGHAEILEYLIHHNPIPAWEKLEGGKTVLHLCVDHHKLGALDVLVRNPNLGGLVFVEDDRGETLLHLAIVRKRVEIVRYLLESNNMEKRLRNFMCKTAHKILSEKQTRYSSHNSIKISAILQQAKRLSQRREFRFYHLMAFVWSTTLLFLLAGHHNLSSYKLLIPAIGFTLFGLQVHLFIC